MVITVGNEHKCNTKRRQGPERGHLLIFKMDLKKNNLVIRMDYISSGYGPVQRLLNTDIILCFHILVTLGIS